MKRYLRQGAITSIHDDEAILYRRDLSHSTLLLGIEGNWLATETSGPEVFSPFECFTIRFLIYREASYKPYIIAAMILLGKAEDAAGTLERLLRRKSVRSFI